MKRRTLTLPTDDQHIHGDLRIPEGARSLVIFLSGSGNDVHSFNRRLATHLENEGFATLLFDLVTRKEKEIGKNLDIDLLKRRIITIATWLGNHDKYYTMDFGFVGIGRGVAPAILAAAELGSKIKAVIFIDGQPDPVKKKIPEITSPTLLIVPEYDFQAIKQSNRMLDLLATQKNRVVISGASHFFEEPRKLEQAARAASTWFSKYLANRLPQLRSYKNVNK